MRRHLLALAALLSLFSPAAQAANSTVSTMTAASALTGAELLYVVQGAADRKGTPAQFATYIEGLITGDCTIVANAIVCTKTNGVAFTSAATTAIGTSGATIPLLSTANTWTLGQTFSAAPTFSSISGSTQCLNVNSAGLVSGTGAVCGGSGSSGANPTATASDVAVNGVATTFLRSDGAPAIQKTSASVFGLVKVDGTTITAASGVASVNPGCGISTSGGSVAANVTARNNTLTTDTLVTGDCGALVTESNASPVAVGIAQAGTTGFLTGFYTTVKNKGAGLVTITPTTSTMDGAATLTLKQNQSVDIVSDGTNYYTLPGRPTNVACGDVSGAACLIASGTAALGTSAISSAACATVVTSTATGAATTDVVTASFNGDPTAVTGYVPLTTGMLTIIVYPTANTANFKVCNNTSASITPGAITLNWRVVR